MRFIICFILLFDFYFQCFADIFQAGSNKNHTVNIDSVSLLPYLKRIDSIAVDGINKRAYPGCQIAILLNGKALYDKSFGYHTYGNADENNEVHNTDLYDIASLTKVAATTLCIMKLVDEMKIKLDNRLSDYLPYLRNSNKSGITIREVLAHQSGLKAWIPFYKFADNKIFSSLKSDNYHIIVTENIFLRNDYRDTIFKQIIDSPLIPLTYSGLNSHNTESHIYLYSDLGFYLFADMILRITGMQIDEYVYENFYKPMGLNRIVYCPLNKFSTEEIVPTEYDSAFRKQLIHGYVHDPGAAMLGGISGHAGLFANAGSLASLMQMLLQNGAYNGKQYISQATVREFTRYQFPENNNRRALGFDKPVPDKAHINKNQLNCAESASKNSFGHSGFTGTFLWVDPDYHLVYVFLSNRVYPDSKNNKLSEMNIRTNIQQVIYNGLLKTNPQISKPK